MSAVLEWIAWLFSADGFIARAECAGLSPAMVRAFAAFEAMICASYVVFAFVFATIIRRRHVPEIRSVFWLIGAFVLFCGFTHAFGVVVFWWPCYRFGLALLAVTATFSVAAVIVTARLLPLIMSVPNFVALSDRFMHIRRNVREQLFAIVERSKTDPEGAMRETEQLAHRIEGP